MCCLSVDTYHSWHVTWAFLFDSRPFNVGFVFINSIICCRGWVSNFWEKKVKLVESPLNPEAPKDLGPLRTASQLRLFFYAASLVDPPARAGKCESGQFPPQESSQEKESTKPSLILVFWRSSIPYFKKETSGTSLHLFSIEIKTEIMFILQWTHVGEANVSTYRGMCAGPEPSWEASTRPSAALVCLRQQSFRIKSATQ